MDAGVAFSTSTPVDLCIPCAEIWSWVLQLAEGSGSEISSEVLLSDIIEDFGILTFR